jgi:hypothetical protein
LTYAPGFFSDGAMRTALAPLMVAVVVVVAASCAMGAPPSRSPLREQLADADTSTVEDATRACLEKTGWKVDPVGSVSGGANVVHATKANDLTQVYIQSRGVTPRITGGPDNGDKLWACLTAQLGDGGAPAASASASSSAASATP